MSFHYSLTARRATWWNTSSHVGRAILHRAMSYVENDKEAIRVMEAAIGYKGLMFENIERRLHDRVWEAVERAAREIGAGSVRDGTLDPWAEDVAELAREMEAIRLDPHHTGIWGDQWPPEEDEPAAVKDA